MRESSLMLLISWVGFLAGVRGRESFCVVREFVDFLVELQATIGGVDGCYVWRKFKPLRRVFLIRVSDWLSGSGIIVFYA